jgi:hypothetical protein
MTVELLETSECHLMLLFGIAGVIQGGCNSR